jgi:hypothetical protein
MIVGRALKGVGVIKARQINCLLGLLGLLTMIGSCSHRAQPSPC